ncbi:esterase-like activity of phytase family protein [Parvularcula sp. IMCC14364]|uniref:esterase-like activity of phytase family protein n=1 Tax=Parvularcula sp. IMCC14364 TaxID=3067902 RepID=UPI0027422842|nr:esterase-like activity of phytase family protein [Parvularcula sp. IMCC14364]
MLSPALLAALSFFVAMPLIASAWIGHNTDSPALRNPENLPVGAWRPVDVKAIQAGTTEDSDNQPVAPFQIGQLKYRGNLVLTSPDRRFGGFSGLRISTTDEHFLAISDRAQWLSAVPVFDAFGAITDLRQVRMATLERYNGEILSGAAGDAEGLELTPDGGVILSFERYHRVDHYLPDRSDRFRYRQRLLHNEIVRGLESNGALESVVLLKDSRVLTLAESPALPNAWTDQESGLVQDGAVPGWVSPPAIWYEGGDDWAPLAYQPAEGFSVTDIAQDRQTGDVYILERFFSRATGVRCRVTRLALEDIKPGTVLKGEEIARLNMLHGIDNLEAMDLRRTEDGRLMMYLMSDDNFNIAQRTVLMSWEVTDR